MKQVFLIILITLVCISTVAAKERFGVRGGLNFADIIQSDDNASTVSLPGMHAGMFYQIPLPSNLMLQNELIYSQKGYKFKSSFGDLIIEIDYLEIPVLLKYDVIMGDFHIQPLIGPYPGFAIRAKNTFGLYNQDIMGNILRTDIGLALGCDFSIMIVFLGAYDMWQDLVILVWVITKRRMPAGCLVWDISTDFYLSVIIHRTIFLHKAPMMLYPHFTSDKGSFAVI